MWGGYLGSIQNFFSSAEELCVGVKRVQNRQTTHKKVFLVAVYISFSNLVGGGGGGGA